MLAATGSVMQLLFPGGSLHRHTLTLRLRQCLLLKACQGQDRLALRKGRCHCTYQPVLQHPHAANAALIEIGPLMQQCFLVNLQRHLLKQSQQHALKGALIRLVLELVARKMNLQAPARRLSVEIAQRQQFIGAG